MRPYDDGDLSDEALAFARGEVARDDGKTEGWAPVVFRTAWLHGWRHVDAHHRAMGLPEAVHLPPQEHCR